MEFIEGCLFLFGTGNHLNIKIPCNNNLEFPVEVISAHPPPFTSKYTIPATNSTSNPAPPT